MSMKKKSSSKNLSEEAIDDLVEAEADHSEAWDVPVKVRKSAVASLSIPAELAARAKFLANLHKEKTLDDWIARIVRERVELEEVAFGEVKRTLSLEKSV